MQALINSPSSVMFLDGFLFLIRSVQDMQAALAVIYMTADVHG